MEIDLEQIRTVVLSCTIAQRKIHLIRSIPVEVNLLSPLQNNLITKVFSDTSHCDGIWAKFYRQQK